MKSKEKKLDIENNTFYFGSYNFKIMILGLIFIVLGFALMMGYDANTKPDGTFDPNYWNDDIFSIRRIRIAPLMVVLGFVIQVFAILVNDKKENKK